MMTSGKRVVSNVKYKNESYKEIHNKGVKYIVRVYHSVMYQPSAISIEARLYGI